MNRIRESMEGIRASRELRDNTLRYLERRQRARQRPVWRKGPSYALAAAMCLLLLFGAGWHKLYGTPTSYISVDVNPSIELGINRYGRVVAAEAYNEDGQYVLQSLSLKNKPYAQAVSSLLENEAYLGYLAENATLVFTIISDRPETIKEGLDAVATGKPYQVLTYTSDSHCMEEAHQYEMSFGKYRGYLELTEYDQSVTIEDCHGMSMGELQDRIEGCRQHEGTEYNGNYGGCGSGDIGGSGGIGDGSGDIGSGSGGTGGGNSGGTGGYDGYSGHHGGHHGE